MAVAADGADGIVDFVVKFEHLAIVEWTLLRPFVAPVLAEWLGTVAMVGIYGLHRLAGWQPSVGTLAVGFARIMAAVGRQHLVHLVHLAHGNSEWNWFECDAGRDVHSIANCLDYGIGSAALAVVAAVDLKRMVDFDLVAFAVSSFRWAIALAPMVQLQYYGRSFGRKPFDFDSDWTVDFVWQSADAVECHSIFAIAVPVLLHSAIGVWCHQWPAAVFVAAADAEIAVKMR